MLIAHVLFETSSSDRSQALATLVAEAATVRAMAGCLRFQPFADPMTETGVGVLHEWESAEAFAGYLASSAFERSGAVLRPLMTGAPISRRFEAEVVETVR